jgi:hypothetical protein
MVTVRFIPHRAEFSIVIEKKEAINILDSLTPILIGYSL